jgi:hypothetical protein
VSKKDLLYPKILNIDGRLQVVVCLDGIDNIRLIFKDLFREENKQVDFFILIILF